MKTKKLLVIILISLSIPIFVHAGMFNDFFNNLFKTSVNQEQTLGAAVLRVEQGGTGIGSYGRGDLITASSTSLFYRLATGTNGQVLKMTSGIPAWGTDSTGGAGGLDTWDILGLVMTPTTSITALTITTATTTLATTTITTTLTVARGIYGNEIHATNELYGSYLVSNFVGSIDMRADPWALSGSSFEITNGNLSLATTGDAYIYFNGGAEYLLWDDGSGDFFFSDDIRTNDTITGSNISVASTTAWNSTYYIVNASSSKWDSTYSIVNSSSSKWDLTYSLVNASSSKWDEAYGWGNHALAGYLTTSTGLAVSNFATDTVSQWVNDSGYITAESDPAWSASSTEYVPYTGATANVDLGANSLVGYLKADGTVDLTGDWTISANNITLTAGTLTANTVSDGTMAMNQGGLTGNSVSVTDLYAKNIYFQDIIDDTKRATFDMSGITTATTRTFTFPDASGTFALTSDFGTLETDPKWTASSTNFANWNAAYGWGNHALAGYLNNSNLYWVANGTSLYSSSTFLKLGIGTTTPASTLQVYGTSTFMGGNVGIGTTDPSLGGTENYSKFTVAGTDNTAIVNVMASNAGIGQVGFVIKRTGTTPERWYQYIPSGSTNLRFYGNGADRVTFTNDGNVGIGTTTPGNTLSVVGTIHGTGNMTILGTITGSNITAASTTNWNTTYYIVNASSSKWDLTYSLVNASSSKWNIAYSSGRVRTVNMAFLNATTSSTNRKDLYWTPGFPVTITEIGCIDDGTSITLSCGEAPWNAIATTSNVANIVCDADSASTTAFQDATIASRNRVLCRVTNVSAATNTWVYIKYNVDD